MAHLLDRGIILHTPRTGGTWRHAILWKNGLLRGVLHSATNYPHPSRDEVRAIFPGKPLCSFVRHPVSWLHSYWASTQVNKGLGVERIRFSHSPWHRIAECEADTFQQFAENYLQRCPGEVGMVQMRYVNCDFVGRYESLEDDFNTALRICGSPLGADVLRSEPPRHVTADVLQPDIPPSLHDAIALAERPFIDRFYPS